MGWRGGRTTEVLWGGHGDGAASLPFVGLRWAGPVTGDGMSRVKEARRAEGHGPPREPLRGRFRRPTRFGAGDAAGGARFGLRGGSHPFGLGVLGRCKQLVVRGAGHWDAMRCSPCYRWPASDHANMCCMGGCMSDTQPSLVAKDVSVDTIKKISIAVRHRHGFLSPAWFSGFFSCANKSIHYECSGRGSRAVSVWR